MGVLEIDQRLNAIMESAPTNLTVEKSVAGVAPKRSESIEEMQVEFTKTLELDQHSSSENSPNAPKLPMQVGETKIQLSFSVDRLLNTEETHSGEISANQELNDVCENLKNCKGASDVECFKNANMTTYAGGSCMDPNCSALLGSANEMQNEIVSVNLKKYAISTLNNEMQEKFYRQRPPPLMPPYLDFKAIVRPTPIRAISSGRETVPLHTPPYSTLATTALLRFQQQKHVVTHTQMLATPPSLLQNLNSSGMGLKSFHNPAINMQNYASPALTVRFPALKTHAHHLLDIPMGTANFISQHHRQQHSHHLAQTSNLATNHASNASTQLQLGTGSCSNINMNNNNSGNGTSGAGGSAGGGAGGGGSSSGGGGKRKRSWSRAVFSNLQRKGLEIQFQQQKYITKPDRRKLAARLNLTDAQVKVWFQNRRMKWRHTRENLKSGQEKQISSSSATHPSQAVKQESCAQSTNGDKAAAGDGYSSDDSSCGELSENDDEIDVVQ